MHRTGAGAKFCGRLLLLHAGRAQLHRATPRPQRYGRLGNDVGIPWIGMQPPLQALPGRIPQMLHHLLRGHRCGEIQLHRSLALLATGHGNNPSAQSPRKRPQPQRTTSTWQNTGVQEVVMRTCGSEPVHQPFVQPPSHAVPAYIRFQDEQHGLSLVTSAYSTGLPQQVCQRLVVVAPHQSDQDVVHRHSRSFPRMLHYRTIGSWYIRRPPARRRASRNDKTDGTLGDAHRRIAGFASDVGAERIAPSSRACVGNRTKKRHRPHCSRLRR